MYAYGMNWWLTKHGRQRFIERVTDKLNDIEILDIAIHGHPGYKFIWGPDRSYPLTGRRLITVLIDKSLLIEPYGSLGKEKLCTGY